MKHAIGCSHPSLPVLKAALKTEHQITDLLIVHSDMKVAHVRTTAQEKRGKRLKKMVGEYNHCRPIYYLELIAANTQLYPR